MNRQRKDLGTGGKDVPDQLHRKKHITMDSRRHSGGTAVTSIDAPAANTDLWTTYLRGQVRSWLDPFGLAPDETVDVLARPLADMAAAAMSGWISLLGGASVRALYNGNKTQVTQFIYEQAIDPDAIEIPAQYMRPAACLPTTQMEEWAITTIHDREPAYAR